MQETNFSVARAVAEQAPSNCVGLPGRARGDVAAGPPTWSENLETVRRAIEAFSRGGAAERALRDADPDAVVDWTRSPGLERGVYRGHEQARRFMETFHELFERVQVDAEELLVGGDTGDRAAPACA